MQVSFPLKNKLIFPSLSLSPIPSLPLASPLSSPLTPSDAAARGRGREPVLQVHDERGPSDRGQHGGGGRRL